MSDGWHWWSIYAGSVISINLKLGGMDKWMFGEGGAVNMRDAQIYKKKSWKSEKTHT